VGPDRFVDRIGIAGGLWHGRRNVRQDVDPWNIDNDIRNSGYNHNGHRCSTHYASPSD
jgi:hypothetical protein